MFFTFAYVPLKLVRTKTISIWLSNIFKLFSHFIDFVFALPTLCYSLSFAFNVNENVPKRGGFIIAFPQGSCHLQKNELIGSCCGMSFFWYQEYTHLFHLFLLTSQKFNRLSSFKKKLYSLTVSNVWSLHYFLSLSHYSFLYWGKFFSFIIFL